MTGRRLTRGGPRAGRVLAVEIGMALATTLALTGCMHGNTPTGSPGQPDGLASGVTAQAGSGAVEIRVRLSSGDRQPDRQPGDRQVAALDGIVMRVRFEISGPNVAGAPSLDVTREQFAGNRATVRWKDLLPGPVNVRASLFDAADRVLARAQGDATIEAGKTSQLDLNIVAEAGSVKVSVDPAVLGEPEAGLGLSFAPIAPGSWQAAPPMAIPRAAHAVVALGGKVFAVGGDFNDMLERFDPETWRWTPQFIPNDPALLRTVGNAAVLKNRIVVIGRDLEVGGKLDAASPVFIDPFAPGFASLEGDIGAFRPVPSYLQDLQQPRTAVGAVSNGETLYMLGGSSRRAFTRGGPYIFVTLDTVEALSAVSGQWSQKAPMPTARGAPGAAWLGGKIYVAGGFRWKGKAAEDPVLGHPGIDSSDVAQEVLNTHEAYDPATDTWTTLAPLPTARHGLALVASGGRLYAIGGATAEGKALATVESYDPGTDSWRSEPALTTPRALLGAVTLADGTILAAGGFGPSGAALRTTEAFLPEARP